jgi:predicted HTH domain antitoxin
MGTRAARTLQVMVDLPEEAFGSQPRDPKTLARDLLLLWLVELVRQRRLAHGKAAELAEMSRWDFIQEMGRHGVTPFDYDDDDLAEEFRR